MSRQYPKCERTFHKSNVYIKNEEVLKDRWNPKSRGTALTSLGVASVIQLGKIAIEANNKIYLFNFTQHDINYLMASYEEELPDFFEVVSYSGEML